MAVEIMIRMYIWSVEALTSYSVMPLQEQKKFPNAFLGPVNGALSEMPAIVRRFVSLGRGRRLPCASFCPAAVSVF